MIVFLVEKVNVFQPGAIWKDNYDELSVLYRFEFCFDFDEQYIHANMPSNLPEKIGRAHACYKNENMVAAVTTKKMY